jgi:heat-inducible transcriptional repressor
MDLDSRARTILRLVVESYIDDAQPVSSAAVARRSRSLALSSATIRAAMAELEQMGLLHQPHTSAGRIPTEQGLRAYLDEVMSPKLHPWDRSRLDQAAASPDPSDFPTVLGQSLAALSGQVAVVAVPRFLGSRVREVGLVRVSARRFLAYFVSPGGFVQQKLVEMDFDLSAAELTEVQNFLNEKLRDRGMDEARALVRAELAEAEALRDSMRVRALEICRQALPDPEMKVLVEGATHLVEQPEFADVEKLRGVLRALDDKANVLRLLDRILDTSGVRVLLGSREAPELACVGSGMPTPSGSSGVVSLIGPLRMDYGRLVPMVSYALELFDGYWQRA